jgi:hypothetical protein
MRQRDPRAVATYKVEFDRLGKRITASTEDVSRRGLFVRTVEFLPAGEVVELFVFLDPQIPVRMVSRVAHVLSREGARALGREPGMGFEFLEHDPARWRRCAFTSSSTSRAPAPAASRWRVPPGWWWPIRA